MTVELGSAVVRIGTDTSELSRGIDGAKLLMLGLGAAAAGAAGEALKMAGNFQAANTLLITSAGESQKNIAMVGAGMLKMSIDTGTSITELQKAMFTLESSGAHGKAGLLELQAAAEGAKVENADLTGVVQALATTMHDWQEPATQAIDVMNSFRQAAAIGNMRMDDFTGAMKNVGPVASLLKIPLTDVEAALSTMSLEGDKGAAAGTHLAQSLMNMLHPSSAAVSVLKEIGLTSQQVSDDLKKSLPDTLALITEDLAKKFPEGSAAYNNALATMFGGTRGLKSILELTGQNLSTFESDAKAIAPTMTANSTAVDGWAQVQKNFNFQVDQAHQALNVMGTVIGTELMPIASAFIQNTVVPAIQHFSDWATHTTGLHDAFQTLANITGTVVTDIENLATGMGQFVGWVIQGGPGVAALAGGLSAVATAIGLIKIEEFAAGIFNMVQQLKQGNGFLSNMATQILPNVSTAFGVTKQAAIETGAAVTAIGPEAVAAEGVTVGAAVGMQLAMSVATAGISLLVGVVVMSVMNAKNSIINMTDDVKKSYDALGSSAADTATKTKAAAIDTSATELASAANSRRGWEDSFGKAVIASNKARAQMIIDQQLIEDAAAKADKAWSDAASSAVASIEGILAAAGWNQAMINQYTGAYYGPTISSGGTGPVKHASGGTIGPGEYGIVGDPGPYAELVAGGTQGLSVLPAAQTAQLRYGGSSGIGASGAGSYGGGGSKQPLIIEIHIPNQPVTTQYIDDIGDAVVKRIRLRTGVRV